MFKINPKVDDLPDEMGVVYQGVKLLLLGCIPQGGGGCFCPENVLLKNLVRHLLVQGDEALIIDVEAGLEHLGRGSTGYVDALIIVVEPGQRAINTAQQIKKLGVDLHIKRILIVGNKVNSCTRRHARRRGERPRRAPPLLRGGRRPRVLHAEPREARTGRGAAPDDPGVPTPAPTLLREYIRGFLPVLVRHAGHPALQARKVGGYVDAWNVPPDPGWSFVGVMRYRSRRDMAQLATDRRFVAAHPFKLAAIPVTASFPTAPRFALLLEPRILLGLVLALAAALLQLVLT